MTAEHEATARAIAARELGGVASLALLAAGKHHVWLATTPGAERWVVKVYSDEPADGLIPNWELAAYRHLAGAPAVRTPLAASPRSGDEPGFVVLPYVEGPTLVERLADDPGGCAQLVSQIVDYVRACAQISTSGFGPLASDLVGCASWPAFLEGYLDRARQDVEAVASARARRSVMALWRTLHESLATTGMRELLAPARSTLVPIDLNVSNFVVDGEDRLVALDLDAFWGADPLLALGEWAGHAYGTQHYSAFLRRWGPLDSDALRVVRLYALLSNFDVALFVCGRGGELDDLRPWGNPIALTRLARVHANALTGRGSHVFAEHLLSEARPLGGDWGVKSDPDTAHRATPAHDVTARLERAGEIAGVSRVADITNLDITGIHVVQAIRPEAQAGRDTFTVFAGKGRTLQEARLVAVAEAVERFCAERSTFDPDRIVVSSYADLRLAGHRVVHPRDFNTPQDVGFSETEPLEWIAAFDLMTGAATYVTANTVFYPYVPVCGRALARHFTTGLATASTYVEGVAHGLAEVIERDAAALNRILRNNPVVDLQTIDSPAALDLLARMQQAGLDVIVRCISAADLPVPVFSVICEDRQASDPMFVNGGYGAHPNKHIAVVHALAEAAQSRTGTISGAREDLQKFEDARRGLDYEQYKRNYRYWFDTSGDRVDYRTLASAELPTVLDDLAFMCEAVLAAGFPRILIVDLSRDELDVTVVKVLVPGVERYSFQMRCVGPRARRGYRQRFGRELLVPHQRQ